MSLLRKFLHEEEGATSIEYALIASLLSVFIIGSVRYFTANLNSMFNTISNTLPG